jgi:hypothetical protein
MVSILPFGGDVKAQIDFGVWKADHVKNSLAKVTQILTEERSDLGLNYC